MPSSILLHLKYGLITLRCDLTDQGKDFLLCADGRCTSWGQPQLPDALTAPSDCRLPSSTEGVSQMVNGLNLSRALWHPDGTTQRFTKPLLHPAHRQSQTVRHQRLAAAKVTKTKSTFAIFVWAKENNVSEIESRYQHVKLTLLGTDWVSVCTC